MTGGPRVLVVQHQADCPAGLLGEGLAAEGCQLDVRRAWRGDPLDLRDDPAGVLVLGGSPNAHDDAAAPWLPAVRALCRDAIAGEVPLLGVCLGHQLIGAAVGGRSAPNPHGQQIGVLPMGWLPAAATDPLLGPVSAARAVQWNTDVLVDLPEDVSVLARAAGGEVQAARFGPAAWGLQCHPEADATIVAGWAEHDRQDCAARGVDVDEYVSQVRSAEADLARDWRGLATSFAALAVGQRVG